MQNLCIKRSNHIQRALETLEQAHRIRKIGDDHYVVFTNTTIPEATASITTVTTPPAKSTQAIKQAQCQTSSSTTPSPTSTTSSTTHVSGASKAKVTKLKLEIQAIQKDIDQVRQQKTANLLVPKVASQVIRVYF